MNWFYSENSQTQRGPVDQAEFDRLVQAGVIRRSTLVWRDGMAEWRAFGEVKVSQYGSGAAGSNRCVESGQLRAGRLVTASSNRTTVSPGFA